MQDGLAALNSAAEKQSKNDWALLAHLEKRKCGSGAAKPPRPAASRSVVRRTVNSARHRQMHLQSCNAYHAAAFAANCISHNNKSKRRL